MAGINKYSKHVILTAITAIEDMILSNTQAFKPEKPKNKRFNYEQRDDNNVSSASTSNSFKY